MAAVAAFAFVDDGDLFPDMGAGPVPALETVLDRFAAVVAVEIAAALPSDVGLLHLYLDPRAGRYCLPVVATGGVEFEAALVEHFGVEDNLPLHSPTPRDAEADIALLDVDDQAILVPAHRARADFEGIAFLPRGASPALGHHPARALAV